MAKTAFLKMNGAGNDFVLLDNRDLRHSLDRATIARLCDRHRGIGADGLLLLEPAEDGADYRMRYFNADGGEAEMCGNGARCFARFAERTAGVVDRVSFTTPAGVIRAELLPDARVRVAMTAPTGYRPGWMLEVDGVNHTVHVINTGVPHACVYVEDLEAARVFELGRALRWHTAFQPRGTNVNFLHVRGPGEIAIRTYERGVEAETLACGTGVTASALIHAALHGIEGPIAVHVRGGDTLDVGFTRTLTPGDFSDVTLCGPAEFTFEGSVEI